MLAAMKRTIFFLSLLLGTSPLPHAQEIDGVTVGNLKMDRNGEYLVVEMDVCLLYTSPSPRDCS